MDYKNFIKKYRIDKHLKLKDMAEKLNFTSSYLSAIEYGKRQFPKKFYEMLTQNFDFNDEEKEFLSTAIKAKCCRYCGEKLESGE